MKEKLLYWINRIIYKSNMNYTYSKICAALKRGESICCIEYPNATKKEIDDIIARLKYLGYNIYFTYISPTEKNLLKLELNYTINPLTLI